MRSEEPGLAKATCAIFHHIFMSSRCRCLDPLAQMSDLAGALCQHLIKALTKLLA